MELQKENKFQKISQSIIEALKNGTAPWIKPWNPDQSVVPHNPVTGTRYKGVNFLYLTLQGKSDPRWVTFLQAQKNGWQVKHGSKGTIVQYWQFEKDKKTTNEQGESVTEKVKLSRPLLRHYYVFNADDIEGIPELASDPKLNNEWERHERAENILQQSGAKIDHLKGNKALYHPRTDSIILPERGQFDAPDRYYATALHELGHWTGHESRLKRNLSNVFGSRDYAREELRAEIASYMIGMQLGVGHDPGQHLAYVDSWVRDLEDHPTEIFRACADAEKIQSYVMAFDQVKEKSREDSMVVESDNSLKDEVRAMPDRSTDPVNHLAGKRFISFFARKEIDSAGTINLELPQTLQRGNTVGVLRFENALEKSLSEKSEIDMGELAKTGIDGVVFTKNGKPFAAIATNKKQLYPGMYQAAKGVEKQYLNVPFEEKDNAKQLGALWDKFKKSWYIPEGLNKKPFHKWQQGQSVIADNPPQQFAEFIKEMGGDLQGNIPVMDGKIHRIPEIEAKPGNKNIAYVGYLDGVPAGYVKNFRGEERRWKMAGAVLTDDDRARLGKEAQEKKTRREKERQEMHVKKSMESQEITNKLAPATGMEAYFTGKGINIQNPGVKIDAKDNIVVPLVDIDGQQWSHQILQHNGFKQIFKDSRLQGTFAMVGAQSIQDLKGDILIAEGYSTAATIHEATGKPVIASTSSNNLKHVAAALHSRYPTKSIYIMADDDRYLINQGKINAGMVKAMEAAEAVSGHVISPDFDDAKMDKSKTDFNDMARIRGKETVKKHIQAKLELAQSGKKLEKHKNCEQEQQPTILER